MNAKPVVKQGRKATGLLTKIAELLEKLATRLFEFIQGAYIMFKIYLGTEHEQM